MRWQKKKSGQITARQAYDRQSRFLPRLLAFTTLQVRASALASPSFSSLLSCCGNKLRPKRKVLILSSEVLRTVHARYLTKSYGAAHALFSHRSFDLMLQCFAQWQASSRCRSPQLLTYFHGEMQYALQMASSLGSFVFYPSSETVHWSRQC